MTINVQKRAKQRGVALLMVLIALVILGTMTADFMESNQVYVITAINHGQSVQAEYLAKSAVNMSRLLLSVQSLPMMKNNLNFPFWRYADLMMEPFASSAQNPAERDGSDTDGEDARGGLLSELTGFSLDEAEGLGLPPGQSFTVTIVDEESKLNVNRFSLGKPRLNKMLHNILATLVEPETFDELFSQGNFRESVDREQLICEIQDFVDQDEDSCRGVGGEESYYSNTDPLYDRKNAPFDSLQELHLVHGIGDDFWSALVEPDFTSPESRILTVWGSGQVNFNTASSGALMSTLCFLAADENGVSPCANYMVRQNLAQLIQLYQAEAEFMPAKNATEFIDKMNNPQNMLLVALTGANVQPFPVKADRNTLKSVFGATSKVFSIYATGEVGHTRKQVHAVVDMVPKVPDMIDPSQQLTAAGGKVLYWRLD